MLDLSRIISSQYIVFIPFGIAYQSFGYFIIAVVLSFSFTPGTISVGNVQSHSHFNIVP